MNMRHSRASLLAVSLFTISIASTGCGTNTAADGATGRADAEQTAPSADKTASSGDTGVPCPLDESKLTSLIGVAMKRKSDARCGFAADPPQSGKVIEIYYTPVDAMVYEGSEGEVVSGVGDGARWDTQMSGSLLVKKSSRYFSIQAVAMGDLPDKLRPKNLAITVATSVLSGSSQ